MRDNFKIATSTINELREQRNAYQDFAKRNVVPLFQDNDQLERRPPRFFVDSSYLYARSFDEDNGSRPFANQEYWLSPDIHVSPITDLSAYTRNLNAGSTYNLRCTVRNRGDRVIPSAKVEFWLTEPSLGFNTRFATHLTLGNVPSTWVTANSTAEVNFPYTVPPTESGHKCLFARLFSFSPLDIPVDDFALDPTIDRHVAQLNLNIIQQGEPFRFNWIHAPNADQTIQFEALAPEEIFALRHPILADAIPTDNIPNEEWIRRARVELADSDATDIEVSSENNSLFVITRDDTCMELQEQREIRSRVRDVLAQVDAGRAKMSEHRNLFAAFREMNSQAQRSIFQMQIPDLGLDEKQFIGVHLRSVDRDGLNSETVTGGLTLLIIGG